MLDHSYAFDGRENLEAFDYALLSISKRNCVPPSHHLSIAHIMHPDIRNATKPPNLLAAPPIHGAYPPQPRDTLVLSPGDT